MAKGSIIAIILLLSKSIAYSKNTAIQVKVDERVELISLVCRLADYEEYIKDYDYNKRILGSPEYKKDIVAYFDKFKTDSLIQYAKEIRKSQHIAYDAPMKFAVSTVINDNTIQFIPNLAQGVEMADKRWTKASADKFLVLLNKFYSKSDFHSFFEQHKPIYSKMEANFTGCISNIKLEWFEKFYGVKGNNTFSIILSGQNGGGNYGPRNVLKDGSQKVYSILGPWVFDSTLVVQSKYVPGIIETTIHEFNHTFCNPLIDKYFVDIEGNSTKMYKCVKSTMNNQAYGNSKTMMSELLVRSGVIKYLKDDTAHVNSQIESALREERLRGFYWIDTVFFAMQEFDGKRTKYPTLDSYMPELVKLINTLETKKFIKAFEQNCPKLHIESSIANGDKNVNPATKELVLKFDRKMDISANGTTYGKKGKKYYPKTLKAHWNSDNKQEWIIEVELEPNSEYSIAFPYEWFRDEKGFPGKKGKYNLDFKTGK